VVALSKKDVAKKVCIHKLYIIKTFSQLFLLDNKLCNFQVLRIWNPNV